MSEFFLSSRNKLGETSPQLTENELVASVLQIHVVGVDPFEQRVADVMVDVLPVELVDLVQVEHAPVVGARGEDELVRFDGAVSQFDVQVTVELLLEQVRDRAQQLDHERVLLLLVAQVRQQQVVLLGDLLVLALQLHVLFSQQIQVLRQFVFLVHRVCVCLASAGGADGRRTKAGDCSAAVRR